MLATSPTTPRRTAGRWARAALAARRAAGALKGHHAPHLTTTVPTTGLHSRTAKAIPTPIDAAWVVDEQAPTILGLRIHDPRQPSPPPIPVPRALMQAALREGQAADDHLFLHTLRTTLYLTGQHAGHHLGVIHLPLGPIRTALAATGRLDPTEEGQHDVDRDWDAALAALIAADTGRPDPA